MIINKYIDNYFLVLFCLIPLTILIGSSVSLINIILIDISFIILVFYNRNYEFLKNKSVLYLFILYIYLIFNSFISINFEQGFLRNFGFIRLIILFLAFNFFFLHDHFYKKVLKFWSLILFIVLIDVFIESIFGKNILGFDGKQYGTRLVSFFKDEPIVGGYLNGFYLLIAGFLMMELKNKNYVLLFLILILFLIAIVLTGERSNSIKAFLGLMFFILLIKSFNFKKKITFISTTIILIFILIVSTDYLKQRFDRHIQKLLVDNNNVYLQLYTSGFQVFKNNKLLGVGNKNYRIETCKEKNENYSYNTDKYQCNTHPHQIYLELLSEHGIIGTFVILFILYKLIFSKIWITIKQSNYIQLGALLYMIFVFTPVIPSGAFFNNHLITIFFTNFSLFYALDRKLNIFKND